MLMDLISKKVTRWFWNGKGYATKKACAMAAARMEMAVYVHMFAKDYFKDDIGTLPRYEGEEKARDLVWQYAAAYLTDSWQCTPIWDEREFTFVGEEDDPRPYFGPNSPYRAYVEKRCREIMREGYVLVQKIQYRDEDFGWLDRWEFKDLNDLIKYEFPWCHEMLSFNGAGTTQIFPLKEVSQDA